MKSLKFGLLTATALFVTPAMAAAPADILSNYGDIAQASYADSLATAKTLKGAIDKFLAEPTEANLEEARSAWIEARNPYQQTEAYRFGNAIVDDWEGKVNAWPLDEGLIDYVDASYGGPSDENAFAALNVIANPTFTLSGQEVDATTITPALLEETLQEADGVNVYRTPDSVMEAQLKAWDVVTERIANDDPFFAKVMESQKAYAKNVMNYLNLNQPDYKLAYNHYFG